MSYSSSFATHHNKQTAAPRVVESHSVQSQFAALTRDRDRLRWEVEAADRQRRQQEGLLGELHNLQTSLSQQIQTAHSSLGTFQKQKTLLENEKARLSTMLHKEREELHACQNKLQRLTETQKHSKETYLQEMHEWNEELEQLLTQAEEKEWKRVISSQTIDMVPVGICDFGNAKQLWQKAITKKLSEEQAYKDLVKECDEWRARAQKQQVSACTIKMSL